MKTANTNVVHIKGVNECKAKVGAQKWVGGSSNELEYQASVTKGGIGEAIITVSHADALAAPPSFENALDGNQGKSLVNGMYPNRTNYQWTVLCA